MDRKYLSIVIQLLVLLQNIQSYLYEHEDKHSCLRVPNTWTSEGTHHILQMKESDRSFCIQLSRNHHAIGHIPYKSMKIL